MEEIVKQLSVLVQNAYSRMWQANIIDRKEYKEVFKTINELIKRCDKITVTQSEEV